MIPAIVDQPRRLADRHRRSRRSRATRAVATGIASGVYIAFAAHLIVRGFGWLDLDFLTALPSRFADQTGIGAALTGSVMMIVPALLVAIPGGIIVAMYLEELAAPSRSTRILRHWMNLLATTPPVIHGIVGLLVATLDLGLGRSLAAGTLTLTALLLPRIAIRARGALAEVPAALRHHAWSLGASRWQTLRHHVIPAARRHLLAASTVAVGRTFGDAAPLVVLGGLIWVAASPAGPHDPVTALPLEVFGWATRPEVDFRQLAAAGATVLLALYTFIWALGWIWRGDDAKQGARR
ncbi:MAG: ABC transporter permease subunit [Acidobacteriota bacterium]